MLEFEEQESIDNNEIKIVESLNKLIKYAEENDGYSAVQVAYGDTREKLVNKPKKGHLAKAGLENKKFLTEFKFENAAEYELGQEIKADIFAAGDKIDFKQAVAVGVHG